MDEIDQINKDADESYNLSLAYATNGKSPFMEIYLNSYGYYILRFRDDANKAKDYFNKAINYNPNFPYAYYNLGFCYQSEDQIVAMRYFEEAIEHDNQQENPEMDQANVSMGFLMITKEKWTEAHKYFNKALKINHDNVNAWYYQGYAFIKLQKYVDAIYCFDKTLLIEETNPAALYSKGYAFIKLQKYVDAIYCFDKALLIEENNQYIISKGYSLLALGDYEDSKTIFQQALENDPDDNQAKYGIALACYYLQEFQQALGWGIKMREDEHLFEKYNLQGLCYLKMELFEEAEHSFLNAIKNSDSGEAFYNLALVYNKNGKNIQAKKMLENCLGTNLRKIALTELKRFNNTNKRDWFEYWFEEKMRKSEIKANQQRAGNKTMDSGLSKYIRKVLGLNKFSYGIRKIFGLLFFTGLFLSFVMFLLVVLNVVNFSDDLKSSLTGVTVFLISIFSVFLLLPSIRRINVANIELNTDPISTEFTIDMKVLLPLSFQDRDMPVIDRLQHPPIQQFNMPLQVSHLNMPIKLPLYSYKMPYKSYHMRK
jgi:tetratricopeptide (TPR) repeat protein